MLLPYISHVNTPFHRGGSTISGIYIDIESLTNVQENFQRLNNEIKSIAMLQHNARVCSVVAECQGSLAFHPPVAVLTTTRHPFLFHLRHSMFRLSTTKTHTKPREFTITFRVDGLKRNVYSHTKAQPSKPLQRQ